MEIPSEQSAVSLVFREWAEEMFLEIPSEQSAASLDFPGVG